MKKFYKILPDCHTLIISGTKADGFSKNIFPGMVKEAKNAGKVVILDFRGEDLINSLSLRPDIIKPNFSEFCSTFFPGFEKSYNNIDLDFIVRNKMVEIYRDYGISTILTHGGLDILYLEDGLACSMQVPAIVPVNTTGSGDAFTAGFGSAFHSGKRIRFCIEKGMECSLKNVVLIKPGTIKRKNENFNLQKDKKTRSY